jgi:hypothetical protein
MEKISLSVTIEGLRQKRLVEIADTKQKILDFIALESQTLAETRRLFEDKIATVFPEGNSTMKQAPSFLSVTAWCPELLDKLVESQRTTKHWPTDVRYSIYSGAFLDIRPLAYVGTSMQQLIAQYNQAAITTITPLFLSAGETQDNQIYTYDVLVGRSPLPSCYTIRPEKNERKHIFTSPAGAVFSSEDLELLDLSPSYKIRFSRYEHFKDSPEPSQPLSITMIADDRMPPIGIDGKMIYYHVDIIPNFNIIQSTTGLVLLTEHTTEVDQGLRAYYGPIAQQHSKLRDTKPLFTKSINLAYALAGANFIGHPILKRLTTPA